MDNSDIRKANLIRLLKDYKTQQAFAVVVETPTSYFTQIIKGTLGKNGKPVNLGNTVARRIEKNLNLPHGYMDINHDADAQKQKFKTFDVESFKQQHSIVDDENSVSFKPPLTPPVLNRKRYVPVKAYSKMGMDGYFTDMGYEGNGGDGYVPTHTRGPKAYGIKGTGDSMFPAIRNGWYVVCDPDTEPTPTEFVQVCLKDGRCTIKEFIGINNDVLSLIAVNGGERMSFNMDEVESVTAITDIIPPSQHKQYHPDGEW